jgi:hypothetical protein
VSLRRPFADISDESALRLAQSLRAEAAMRRRLAQPRRLAVGFLIFLGIVLPMFSANSFMGALQSDNPRSSEMNASLLAATVVGVVASVAGADAVQWRVEDGGNGHWYRAIAHSPAIGWDSARQSAASMGGHLATVTSAAENQLAFELSVSAGCWNENAGPYLGAAKNSVGQFEWITGEPFEYSNWLPGEPSSGAWEPALAMIGVPSSHAPGSYWNDYESTPFSRWTFNGSVVEFDADCNNDGIVDYGQCRDGSLPDFNGNNIPDCCEQGTVCTVGSYPVEWRVADGGNGHWYQLIQNGSYLCWTEANARATGKGGTLVSETSPAEHQFVSGRLVSQAAAWTGRWGPWIGARFTGGAWGWSSGEPWTFAAWYPGEPNGGGNEPVVSYIAIGEGGGCGRTTTWNDWLDCATVQPSGCDVGVWNYIVEWSSDCNNDGVVDFGQLLNGVLFDANGNNIPDVCEFGGCAGDINADGAVDGTDLAVVLSNWGENPPKGLGDANGDGTVNGTDLAIVLGSWGPCG